MDLAGDLGRRTTGRRPAVADVVEEQLVGGDGVVAHGQPLPVEGGQGSAFFFGQRRHFLEFGGEQVVAVIAVDQVHGLQLPVRRGEIQGHGRAGLFFVGARLVGEVAANGRKKTWSLKKFRPSS